MKTNPDRAQALKKTKAYRRYRNYLVKAKPKSRKHARKLLAAAFNLVEECRGHHYNRNATAASEVCVLLLEEYPSCIEDVMR